MPDTIPVAVLTAANGPHLDAYFESLAKAPEAGSVILADPSGKTVDRARKAMGDKLTAVVADYGEALTKYQPPLALVSLEAVTAPPVIAQALTAGCHVFAEKPACVKADDFARLNALAQRKHRHLMLAFANRTHAPAVEARRLIREEKVLGKLYGVELHLIADQTRLTGEAYRASWVASKARAGGGHLIWLGIHWLDLAMLVTGLKVEQVAGFAGVVGGQPVDVEDSAAVAIRFRGGVFGTMTSGYYLDKGYQSHIQIWGEHGWMRLASFEGEPLEWYTHAAGKVQRFEYPKADRGYPPFVRKAVRAAAGLEPPPVTGDEGLHVLSAIFAFYEAVRTGQTQVVKG